MINKIIEGRYILFIIASIIPFLTISIFVADLIYSLVAVIFLIYIIRNRIIFDFKNKLFLTSITFYVVCVISSSLSDSVLFSLKSSLPLLRVFLFIFLLNYLISFNKDLINIFYNFLLITFCILILYGFYEYFVQYNLLNNSDRLDNTQIRLRLFFSDEQKLGSFLVRLYGLLLALHIIKKNKSNFQNIFFVTLTLLCSIVILLSGERTSSFFMIMFFFTCFFLLNIEFRTKSICVGLISISLFILLSLNSNLSKRMLFDKTNEISFSKDEIIIFTPQHTAHYKVAAKMFLDKPYFGHGPKMFRVLCSNERYYSMSKNEKSGCSSHPHNTYLQLLAETGLVGMLIFSLGFIYITFTLIKHFLMMIFYRKRSLTDYQIVLSVTVIITFWPFSPAGNIFNNWLLIVYSIPISFYVNEFFGYKKFFKL